MRSLFFVALITLLSFSSSAQITGLGARFDKDSALMGDYLNFSIWAAYKNGQVYLPVLADSIGTFEVLAKGQVYEKDSSGIKYKIQEYRLIQFNPGNYRLGSFPVLYVHDGVYDTIAGPESGIFIKGIQLDTTNQLKPIKGPIQIPYTWKEILPWAIGALLLIAAIIVLIYWLRNRKKKEKPVEIKVTKQEAHAIALQRLRELDKSKKWQQGQIKEYYLELSEIVREYIEDRFLIMAKESTSSEIIEALKGSEANEGLVRNLGEMMVTSDLAKFAKVQPLPDENMKCMKVALDFVTHTKPQNEVAQNQNKK